MAKIFRQLLVCALALAVPGQAALPALAGNLDSAPSLRFGDSAITAEIDEVQFEIYTYRPRECAIPSVLIVFHGTNRNAAEYRDDAKSFADEGCFVIYAPRFDSARFPNWSYHRGGVVEDGEPLKPADWTVGLVADMVNWVARREGTGAPVYLFGHSAGGQFLSRVAAYARPPGVARIVIANPSTHVLPGTEERAPYGFGGMPGAFPGEAALRAYLAAPVTVYLGGEDTGKRLLTSNEQAVRQGENRLDRGRRTFRAARMRADSRGWEFGWKLVEAPGVGHSASGMLNADQMIETLGLGRD